MGRHQTATERDIALRDYRAGASRRAIAKACGVTLNRIDRLLRKLRDEGLIAPRGKEEIRVLMRAAWRPRQCDPEIEESVEDMQARDEKARDAIEKAYPKTIFCDSALARVPLCILAGALALATPAAAKRIAFEIRDRRRETFPATAARAACGSPAAHCADAIVGGQRVSDMREIPHAAAR